MTQNQSMTRAELMNSHIRLLDRSLDNRSFCTAHIWIDALLNDEEILSLEINLTDAIKRLR